MDTNHGFELSFHGLLTDELAEISSALGGVEPILSHEESARVRAGDVLVTASFVLGALRLTPAVVAAAADCFERIFGKRYVTFKMTAPNGTVLEGAGTPERLRELTKLMKSFQSLPK